MLYQSQRSRLPRLSLTDLSAYLSGDSTEEHHFTQYSGAGENAFEIEAANYYSGTVDAVDAAKSGAFLLESTALNVDAGNTNLFWVDDSGALADGPQLTNNIVNIGGSPDIYALSLGINDHSATAGAGVTASDYQAGFEYYANRVTAVHGADTMLNTLSRDTAGNDAGANAVSEGIVNAIGGNIKRGIDVYDLDLTDAKHHTEAGQELKAEREAKQIAYYTNNSSVQCLGPAVSSAVLKTDVLEVTLSHVNGTDITMPSSGAGGIDATDDGTALSLENLTKISATSFSLDVPEGTAPISGSTVKLYVPYGANGGGLASTNADVIKDNSADTLPIQRDVVAVTNGDPIQALDNMVIYFDARGSAKNIDNTDHCDQITALAGSVTTIDEVDAGDHFVFDGTETIGNTECLQFNDVTQMLYTGFTAGETHTIGMVFQHPATLGTGDILFFANAGAGTDNQAKLTFAGGSSDLFWVFNEDSASEIVAESPSSGQIVHMILEFVDADTLNFYYDGDTTPFYTLNPRDDFTNWNSLLLGSRTVSAEDTSYQDLKLGAFFHTTDVLTAQERADIFSYWDDRF